MQKTNCYDWGDIDRYFHFLLTEGCLTKSVMTLTQHIILGFQDTGFTAYLINPQDFPKTFVSLERQQIAIKRYLIHYKNSLKTS